jgi:hypothetical protein
MELSACELKTVMLQLLFLTIIRRIGLVSIPGSGGTVTSPATAWLVPSPGQGEAMRAEVPLQRYNGLTTLSGLMGVPN